MHFVNGKTKIFVYTVYVKGNLHEEAMGFFPFLADRESGNPLPLSGRLKIPEFCCHRLRLFFDRYTRIVTSNGETVHIQICDFCASNAKCSDKICGILRKYGKEAKK